MRRSELVVVGLLALALAQCTPTPTPIPASPTPPDGSIMACAFYNGLPASNATISATNDEGLTFVGEGSCHLFSLPPGKYLIKAQREGASVAMDVTLGTGEQIHLDFWLVGPTPTPTPVLATPTPVL